MDLKRIIKNVLFVALVPSVVVAAYYGYKAFKKYKKKSGSEENKEKDNRKSFDTTQILDKKLVNKKVVKIEDIKTNENK